MVLGKKEQFIATLSITVLEHVPLRYVNKRTVSDLDYFLIDSIYDKLSEKNTNHNIEFNNNEKELILEAIGNCIE